MFKALLNTLFPSTNRNYTPNYFAFEETRANKDDEQQKAVDALQTSLKTSIDNGEYREQEHQLRFYDFLFGKQASSVEHDDLSLFIANKINILLSKPETIVAALPALPVSINKITNELNDDNFDINQLIKLIEQEPAIVAKVIELANSAYYNHTGKSITDLKLAFRVLGVNGLTEGVINGFVNRLVPASPIYFQHYGNKIWQHSYTTGVIAKSLVKDAKLPEQAAESYLVGLLTNIGDMIIFQLLVEAFAHVNADCQPNSLIFKKLLIDYSKSLSYSIAKHWQLPASITSALQLQANLTKSVMLKPQFTTNTLACYVYEANLISELALLLENKQVSNEELEQARQYLIESHEAQQFLEKHLVPHMTQ